MGWRKCHVKYTLKSYVYDILLPCNLAGESQFSGGFAAIEIPNSVYRPGCPAHTSNLQQVAFSQVPPWRNHWPHPRILLHRDCGGLQRS
jgi:hypothetical protein